MKLIYVFDFTNLLVWTFFEFLAYCALQRLLLQVANHKMINEVQHKQFICPMCELRISNSTYEEFEQHVVDHFEQKIMV